MKRERKSGLQTGLTMTPISAPEWDAARVADSFRAFASHVHGMAKDILLRDGHHAEMFFFMPLDGNGYIVLWRSNDRDLEADWLRQHIAAHYIFGVVHVVEAWMHLAPTPGDHTLKQLMAGEMRVSDLRPEHRSEVLMTSAQARDGWAISWVDEIRRNPKGGMSLGECREIGEFSGRFGKVFG